MRKWNAPLLLVFISTFCFGQQKEISTNEYKKKIVNDYYLFQKTENEELLDSILRYVKINNRTIEEDSINSKIYYLRGVKNLFLQQYKVSEELFSNSFKLANKTNDILLQGTIYNSRGVSASLSKKDYKKAEELFKKAISKYEQIEEFPQRIDAYYNLTINSRRREQWSESNEYAFRYLELINQHKKLTGLKRLYYFIADNYLELREFEKAYEYLKKAKSIEFPKDSYNYTTSLINEAYAKLYEEENEEIKALAYYKEVIVELRAAIKYKEAYLEDSYMRELELEKDLKEKNNEIIKDQRRQLYWSILTIILLILLLSGLIYFRKKDKKKNEKINELNLELKELIIDLKEKNKELYKNERENENLLKLNEQALFSRVLRISTYNDSIRKVCKDIEGYLDNSLDTSRYLIMINRKLSDLISEEEMWEDFKIQFEKTRPEFFNKLKKVAPSLSVNDLKHCTYIVANLKSKEVAQLINVSPRSVETTRYRIKKKMGLEKSESLYDLLSHL
ncbi:conserved protein of unknown function [Tenacibaculum sp. 190130A14a]|uniref:HTH luxR-type domain-containing protein n=1 Tax=Tenacibaculum polynesiense TaxID=3137857 RepID=A0ABM9P672_9FLAO